jgi:hypothetical protein
MIIGKADIVLVGIAGPNQGLDCTDVRVTIFQSAS